MSQIAEQLLAGRIGAQDRIIGVLCGAAMSPEPLTANALSALIEAQADAARRAGSVAEAAYLMQRAEAIRVSAT